MSCIICNSKKFETIWNDKLRNSPNSFTKKKEKIFKCKNCNLVFLQKKRKNLEDSSVARKIFNKDNSIKEFLKFHKPREKGKINRIKNYLNVNNKSILESNCGAGIILDIFKKRAKLTSGVDSKHYKSYLLRKGHKFYESIYSISSKQKFDVIFSLSELEHKYDPISFLKQIKKLLNKNGKIILRVPNYLNIYKLTAGKYFDKFDFRTSHNFYFSKKNLHLIFKKVGLKIKKEMGYHEYEFNHLLKYLKMKGRFRSKYEIIFNKNEEIYINKNIEESLMSTSLIYFLEK